MSDLALFTGGTLTAAAADAPEPRVAEGILVPYGQPGRTNLGPKRIARGALRLVAEAPVIGLYGHDRERSASRLIASEDRPEGLWGRLRIPETPTGDLLLAEIRGGVRDGLSVELSDLQYDPADPDLVTSARLDAVAHVPLPAYDSARVTALAATQHPPIGEPSVTAPTTVEPVAPALDYAQLAAALAPHLTAAAAPAGLPTGSLTAAPAASPGLAPSASPATNAEDDPIEHAAKLMAAVHRGAATGEMVAALTDITNSNLPIFQNRSTLGEKLWEGAEYSRRFVGLMRNKPLTDWEFTGWQWVQRPELKDYAGDKTAVPSGPVSTVRVKGTAKRLAGAWDIDQKFVDFDSPEFWAEFWAAGTESYLEKSDARAAAAIASYAVPLETPASYPTLTDDEGDVVWTYSLPEGVPAGLIVPRDILRAAALATVVLEETPRVRKGPDYIGMNTADWLELLEVTQLDVPAFLALLKVNPDQFMHSSKFAAGRLTAGVRNAATFRELGSTPIRVSAKNVAQGGVDEGLFGYTGVSMDRPGGIISLPLTAAAG